MTSYVGLSLLAPSSPLPVARSKDRKPTARGAFTLIELLVVIAIIALLISILLPSISSARERSRSAVCQANLRAINIGYRIYADENNDLLMPSGGISDLTGSHYWNFFMSSSVLPDVHLDSSLGLLSPYLGKIDGPTRTTTTVPTVGTLKVTICPTKPLGTLTSWLNPVNGFTFNGPGAGYAVRSSTVSIGTGIKMSGVTLPADTFSFADSDGLNASTQQVFVPPIMSSQVQAPVTLPSFPGFPSGSQPAAALNALFQGRHNGLGNVAWIDGHVTTEHPYLNSSMTSYATCSKLNIGYLSALPPATVWTDFVNSYNKVGTANANYYFWTNKDSSY